ncbi:MAG: 2OG-Fe(II) oxygenase [Steroidobacteraceae bacterium]
MPDPTPQTQLALAAQHDAAGHHHDAIDALARGTSAGDLVCMTQLGKRLLVGDRAPALAKEGARFLLEAATKGEAEAAARMATLTALGVCCKQSWPEALRWLIVAAERQWQLARGQLLVLAEGSTEARLDLASWWVSPPVRELSTDPRVRTLDSFITTACCEWLIARARHRLTRARVYDPVNRQDVIGQTRTNSVANFALTEVELLDVLLQAKMSSACGVPMNHMEAPAVLHYGVGEEASNHYDFVDPATPDYAGEIGRNGQRIVTFLVYLNDDYEGGETGFPTLGFSHKGCRGQGLFFVNAHADMQPDLRMLHAGRPPTRGEKWIVSQFIRSRATLVPTPPPPPQR